MLCDLGIFLPTPPTLWCDNINIIYLMENLVFHARTKHIEVDFHFISDRVSSEALAMHFIPKALERTSLLRNLKITHNLRRKGNLQ